MRNVWQARQKAMRSHLKEFYRADDLKLIDEYGETAAILDFIFKANCLPPTCDFEEFVADLASLYLVADPKMQTFADYWRPEIAEVTYLQYFTKGLLLYPRPGASVVQRGIAKAIYDRSKGTKALTLVKENGKNFVVINDYAKVKSYIGEILRNLTLKKVTSIDCVEYEKLLKRVSGQAEFFGVMNPALGPMFDQMSREVADIKLSYENMKSKIVHYSKSFALLSPNACFTKL